MPPSPSVVERFVRSDPRAFESVYDDLAPAAFGLARRICRCDQLADEVTQRAFVDVWRHAARYDPGKASLTTWVLAIVRHRSLDALRRTSALERRTHPQESALDDLAAADCVLDRVIEGDRALHVREAVRALPAEQREVLELAYFEGLTHVEVATRLGLPVGTVKSRIRLGLMRCRERITSSAPVGSRADDVEFALTG